MLPTCEPIYRKLKSSFPDDNFLVFFSGNYNTFTVIWHLGPSKYDVIKELEDLDKFDFALIHWIVE